MLNVSDKEGSLNETRSLLTFIPEGFLVCLGFFENNWNNSTGLEVHTKQGQREDIFDFSFCYSLKAKYFIKNRGSRRLNGLFFLWCINTLNQYFINIIHSYMPFYFLFR